MNEKISPFLWLRGEDKNLIEKEIESIYNCNMRSFVVESRTHPDFAEKAGGAIWILC